MKCNWIRSKEDCKLNEEMEWEIFITEFNDKMRYLLNGFFKKGLLNISCLENEDL